MIGSEPGGDLGDIGPPRRSTWALLLLVSLALTVVVFVALIGPAGMSARDAATVAFLLLCTDLVGLAMVWYMGLGGASVDGQEDVGTSPDETRNPGP